MKHASWTYELPPTGAGSEGLEDYEARGADGKHVGVVVGLVRRAGTTFVIVDAGAMPPLLHRRLAVRWEDVEEVDHAALVVQLSLDRAGLEEAALALNPKKAMHGSGAEAAQAQLPVALLRPFPPGHGPAERGSAIAVAALAAAAPFSLFAIAAVWMARGLRGWEYGLLAIPFVLAALTVALEGYRLYREPHVGHGHRVRGAVTAPREAPRPGAVHRWVGGKGELVLFAVGGGVLYLTMLLGVTVALGEGLPLLGWIGFAVASAVVLGASTILAIFLVRSSTGAGSEAPQRQLPREPGVHRLLVIADESCSGAALCRPLVERVEGRRTEVLVVAPAVLSAVHYLDSDVDAAREAAQARLAETVAAFTLAGVTARGQVGSESPLEAIADALAVFAADEIVVATPPPERTNWLEENIVEQVRELYEAPVLHLVVETPVGAR